MSDWFEKTIIYALHRIPEKEYASRSTNLEVRQDFAKLLTHVANAFQDWIQALTSLVSILNSKYIRRGSAPDKG